MYALDQCIETYTCRAPTTKPVCITIRPDRRMALLPTEIQTKIQTIKRYIVHG